MFSPQFAWLLRALPCGLLFMRNAPLAEEEAIRLAMMSEEERRPMKREAAKRAKREKEDAERLQVRWPQFSKVC